MKILGIHDGINASACLLENGKITQCIQEERLTNIKNYIGFPLRSIQKILSLSKCTGPDLTAVALSSDATFYSADPASGLLGSYRKNANFFRSWLMHCAINSPFYSLYSRHRMQQRLKNLEQFDIPVSMVRIVDHHLCHAATAYYGAPWRDGKTLVMTSDGSGDGLCASVYIGESGDLSRIASTKAGNSIADIYARVTFMLGLTPHEHEWKVMGLAPYASEKAAAKSREVIARYLSVPDSSLSFERSTFEPTNLIYRRLRRDLEFYRFDAICAGLQQVTEELIVKWVKNAIAKTDIHRIALAGGTFMNVKASKRLMELPEVQDLFVFPSCGDESTSIGAAYHVYVAMTREMGGDSIPAPIDDIYYGPDFSDDDVLTALKKGDVRFKSQHMSDVDKEVAGLIASGEIVARCSGRMEFGARALGNRSILADPADQQSVRIINMMVKKRDFWMPFAPVILWEQQADYIVNPKRIKSPYMMLTFDTTDKRDDLVAALHQADFTARAQILERSYNPGYYNIIERFSHETDRSVLLNTSFNLHGYPVVCSPDEALWVFANSGLKYLALGNHLISKSS